METILSGAVLGALAGAIGGGVAALLVALFKKPMKCPDCGFVLPKVSRPANRRQALWGGRTCPECGCEVDRRGRKVEG